MPRWWLLWGLFVLGAAAVLAAMAWLTRDVHVLARIGVEASRRVRVDAAARSALWRMDSALAALLAAEAVDAGSSASPPTACSHQPPPLDRLPVTRFRRAPAGAVQLAPPEASAEPALARLRGLIAALPAEAPIAAAPARPPEQQGDYQARQALNVANASPRDPLLGPARALWLGDDQLALVRSAADGSLSGSVIAADALAPALAALAADLLPQARILPCADPGAAAYPLATMPLRLEPGALPSDPPGPLLPTLTVAWICVVAAIVAMGALLAGATALAERRAAFVSAVTHELRTPITSLRLYADLLAEGVAAGEAKRAEYLATIRAEAERLGRLVDNVLAFARLERAPRASAVAARPLAELVASCREPLARRAGAAGIELVVELGAAGASNVRLDAAALERILFNLVDNACKYAVGGERRIELVGELRRGAPTLLVRDHGPGIAADARARLFRPFSRSAREAAGSAPGVGLGLALSRRLARRMGGDLTLEPAASGACFAVTLRA